MQSHPPSPRSPTPFPVRAFRSALFLYPKAYRRRFGREMEQVFHDQWSDVRASGSVGSTIRLLVSTLADLAVSSLREHVTHPRSPMNHPQFLKSQRPIVWSLGAGILVTAIIVGLTAVATVSMPKAYKSTARLNVSKPDGVGTAIDDFHLQNEIEVARSMEILNRSIAELSLNERWRQRYLPHSEPGTLSSHETLSLLQNQITVQPIRLTRLMDISAWDSDPQLAADMANAVANAYRSLRTPPSNLQSNGSEPSKLVANPTIDVSIIDAAQPSVRPLRPNLPLNIVIATVAGGLFGALTAAAVGYGLWRRSRRASQTDIPVAS